MVSIKQILISLVLPIIVTILIPAIILILIELRTFVNLFNENLIVAIFGLIFLILGIILFIKCNYLFIKVGKGKLIPMKGLKTQILIIKGPYRYVRHPMIISVIVILFGEGLLFGSLYILLWDLIFFIGNTIYLPFSEDKDLEKRFGKQFFEYKNSVRAWIPRLTPYQKKEKNHNK